MSQLQLSIYTAAYVAYFSVIAAGFSSKLPPLNNLIRHAWQPKHNLMMTSTPPATASENGTKGTTGGDAWEQVRAKQMADESFSAACIDVDHKRKGAIFLVDGLRAFLPKVHLSTSASGQCALSDDLIGRILLLKILEIDREKDKVVVSHCRAMGEADPNEMVIEDAQQPASSADGDDERQQPPSKRRLRKRAKKMEALRRRAVRIAKNGGPPETTFLGEHKWLGGAVDPDTGKIYGIPSHSHKVICITPSSSDRPAKIATIGLPAEYQRGKFKWLRGVVHEGCLYGIPAWSTKGVLKVKLDTREVSVLPLPRDISNYQPMDISHYQSDPNGDEGDAGVDRGRWMWHGGAIGWSSEGDGNVPAIYCPPSNAEYVLKVYLDGSDRVEEIGTALPDGQNKWYGGIPGADGCIYAPPYTATGWLRVDPKTDTVEVLGDFPPDQYGWHGGLLAKSTGVIYAFPAHSNEVLCIDTNIRRDKENRDDNTWRVSTIPIKRHPDDTDSPDLHYKWREWNHGSVHLSIVHCISLMNYVLLLSCVPAMLHSWRLLWRRWMHIRDAK